MVRTTRTPRDAGWTRVVALAAVTVWLLATPTVAATDFSKYHTHAELSAALGAAVAAQPDLAKLVSLGKSREGRDIWAIEIAFPRGTPIDQRPALLIAANFEGDHVIGSELALFMAEALLKGYPGDAAIKQRLEQHVFYVVPRVNPDGAERMFAAVKTGGRTNLTPYDADNDARMDEDGPEDLNKDGVITVMRVKDPAGPYTISSEDARLMKKADPAKGEKGGWAIYSEGIDNDGDGFINEDWPGGVDINRNFMHQYPYFAPDAGRHMASELETRALLDYVLKRRNIAAILTFGASDNLIAASPRATAISLLDYAEASTAAARKTGIFAAPTTGFGGFGGGMMFTAEDFPGFPGGGRATTPAPSPLGGFRPPTRNPVLTINPADTEYLRVIADKYRELTGLRSAPATRTPAGAFFEYGYYQYGVPSFSTPGWGLPGAPAAGARPGMPGAGAPGAPPAMPPAAAAAMAPRAGTMPAGMPGGTPGAGRAPGASAEPAPESIDLRILQWMDADKVDGFVPWTTFTHPTLGEVEIGGFKPYATVNPPASKIAELGASHTAFALHLTSLLPKVAIAKAESTTLAAGVYRVKVEIENTGFLPTALAHGVTSRAVLPTMVQIGVPPESIVTGAEKTVYVPSLAGSGGRQSLEWVITAKAGSTVTVKVVSQKGGAASASVTLR